MGLHNLLETVNRGQGLGCGVERLGLLREQHGTTVLLTRKQIKPPREPGFCSGQDSLSLADAPPLIIFSRGELPPPSPLVEGGGGLTTPRPTPPHRKQSARRVPAPLVFAGVRAGGTGQNHLPQQTNY